MESRTALIEQAKVALLAIGLADADSQAVAERFAAAHTEPLDDGEVIAPGGAELLLQIAIAAARAMHAHRHAMIAILAVVEEATEQLSAYDVGRYWHLRALVAWRFENQPFRATDAFNRSIASLTAGPGDPARAARYRARVHDSLGQLLNHQGLLVESRTEFQHALRLRDPQLDKIGLAITHGNLGRLSMDLGDYDSAIENFTKDIALVEQTSPNDTRTRAQLRSHLGVAHLRRGLPAGRDVAEGLFADSERIAAGPPAVPSALAFARLGKAQLALARGDVDAARALTERVLATVADEPATLAFDLPAIRGAAHKLEGDTARTTGDRAGAIAGYERALTALGEPPASSLVEYTEILRSQSALVRPDDAPRATGLLRRALDKLDGTAAADLRGQIEDELHAQDRFAWLVHSTGRFVGNTDVESLLGEAGLHGFRGDAQQSTVLFSDLRGFTTLSETLDPKSLIAVINDYFTLMTHCVRVHGGQVDKFIGDAVMATFSFDARGCKAAIDSALAMRIELERFNRRPDLAAIPLAVGIGIHGGPVVEGLIGSPQKREKTVLGDTVNTASRLEGLTKYLGAEILVSAEVMSKAADAQHYLRRPLGRIVPKGKRAAIEVYDVMGVRDRSAASRLIDREIEQVGDALGHFARRDFVGAAGAFAALASGGAPAGRAVGYVSLQRAAELLAKMPPPDSWRGEIAASEK